MCLLPLRQRLRWFDVVLLIYPKIVLRDFGISKDTSIFVSFVCPADWPSMMVDAAAYGSTPCHRCRERGFLLVDYSAGDVVCSNCGEVNGSRIIDEGDEVHVYNDDAAAGGKRQKTSRTSGLADSLLSQHTTFVLSSSPPLAGGPGSSSQQHHRNQETKQALERAQRLSVDGKERAALRGYGAVGETCARLNIDSTSIKVRPSGIIQPIRCDTIPARKYPLLFIYIYS